MFCQFFLGLFLLDSSFSFNHFSLAFSYSSFVTVLSCTLRYLYDSTPLLPANEYGVRKEQFFSMLVFHPVKRLELLESYLPTSLGICIFFITFSWILFLIGFFQHLSIDIQPNGLGLVIGFTWLYT